MLLKLILIMGCIGYFGVGAAFSQHGHDPNNPYLGLWVDILYPDLLDLKNPSGSCEWFADKAIQATWEIHWNDVIKSEAKGELKDWLFDTSSIDKQVRWYLKKTQSRSWLVMTTSNQKFIQNLIYERGVSILKRKYVSSNLKYRLGEITGRDTSTFEFPYRNPEDYIQEKIKTELYDLWEGYLLIAKDVVISTLCDVNLPHRKKMGEFLRDLEK